MQLVADSGHLLTGLAIRAVTHPLVSIDLTSVVVAAVPVRPWWSRNALTPLA